MHFIGMYHIGTGRATTGYYADGAIHTILPSAWFSKAAVEQFLHRDDIPSIEIIAIPLLGFTSTPFGEARLETNEIVIPSILNAVRQLTHNYVAFY